jgi:hypothetical protein
MGLANLWKTAKQPGKNQHKPKEDESAPQCLKYHAHCLFLRRLPVGTGRYRMKKQFELLPESLILCFTRVIRSIDCFRDNFLIFY